MNPSQANTVSRGLILWESPRTRPVVARIAIAGDFLPSGDVSLPIGANPWHEAAEPLAGHFEDADVSFANLECVLGASGLRPRLLAGLGDIVSAPAASLDYLDAVGSRVASLANNHSYDFGDAGIEQTRQALLARGMVPLGGGCTLSWPPEIFLWHGHGQASGVRVGFWAAALASNDLATRGSPGVEPATLRRAKAAISAIRANGAQLSIALVHAGCLRTNRPDPNEAARMDSIAAEGFDIVAASHSHRIAGARMLPNSERYPRFCFYGLGSIVSGFIASPLEREGLVVVAALDSDGSLARIEVRPVLLGASGFGEAPSPDATSVILDRFRALSLEIADGSAARLFYQDVSQGLIHLYARDIRAAFRSSGLRGLARKAGRVRLRHIRRLVHRVTRRVTGRVTR